MKDLSCKCGSKCKCSNCSCSPYAVFFDTLGNENRLFILDVLKKGQKSVSDIVELTGLEQTHVSHSIKQLEKYGFVKCTKKGKFRLYSVNIHMGSILESINSHVKKYCTKDAKPCSCMSSR